MVIIKPIAIPFKELLEEFEQGDIESLLNSFQCARECFIEDFVQNKCIQSETMGDTKSYFILDQDDNGLRVLGYYALTLRVIHLAEISGKKAKKLHQKEKTDLHIPTYYIAILAKNDLYREVIDGSSILESALTTIQDAANKVGGRVVWVEAKKEHAGVIDFYQKNGFTEFQVEEQHDGLYSHLLKTV